MTRQTSLRDADVETRFEKPGNEATNRVTAANIVAPKEAPTLTSVWRFLFINDLINVSTVAGGEGVEPS